MACIGMYRHLDIGRVPIGIGLCNAQSILWAVTMITTEQFHTYEILFSPIMMSMVSVPSKGQILVCIGIQASRRHMSGIVY